MPGFHLKKLQAKKVRLLKGMRLDMPDTRDF
jgi:hypothetical protein